MQNQKLCLKWNNHMSNMLSLLGSFQQKDMLVDVTISCQGQNIKAHKVILSACSPYFQNIFMENPCQHPIIIINGMKFDDVTAILNFMYKGEVNVSQDGLSSFLQAAEALKVKGLAEVCGEKKGTNSINQEVQQSELNRPQRTDTPPRKRPRNRKRSLSDSNRSDDEGITRKHREPSSPEVHELSGDESFTGDNSSNGPPFNSVPRVPQNVYSRSHQSSNIAEDDEEYDVESNKMLDTSDSNVSMNNTNADNSLRIERIMGNATEIESSSLQEPESPPDIKPIISYGESSAGPSESGNMMLYNEQSQPGPSNAQDSSLLHDNSHTQDDRSLQPRYMPWPKNFKIPVEKFSYQLKEGISTGNISWGLKYELMNHLASEITQYTENPTKYQRNQVAEALLETFPQLKFNLGENDNSSVSLWSLRLHDKMSEFRRKKRINLPGVSALKSSDKCYKLRLFQIRGIVNWSPTPPEGEDDASMYAHKEWLKNEWFKTREYQDIKKITKKMELCFPYRRKEINSDVSLGYLKNEYPFMFTYENILKEFQLLMLVDLEKAFLSNAVHVVPNLMKLVREKRKNSEEVLVILSEFNTIPYEAKKPYDELIACLLILPYLFSVSSGSLYQIYDKNIPIEGTPNFPHVAVIGSAFNSTQIYVVAEGEIIIECPGFIEAIIACMAMYYCCNFKYPDEGKDTYLFIQTQFLNLEHHGKFPRKIVTLIEKLKRGV